MRRLSLLLLHIFFTLFYAAVLPAHADTKAIVIGQAVDLSGPTGAIGRDYVAGITTYFDSLNAGGGINGRKIKYLVRDDHGNPQSAVKAVTELINSERSDYLIGGIGTAITDAVVAVPAFASGGYQLFAPMTESPRDYGERVVFWRPGPEQEIQCTVIPYRGFESHPFRQGHQEVLKNQRITAPSGAVFVSAPSSV